jgi:hypothetical protein
MKEWISGKLFDLAVWLDWNTAADRSISVAVVELGVRKVMAESKKAEPKKKVGRPLGRKDSVGKLLAPAPKKKVGRPLGAKDSAPRKRKVTPA